MSQETVNPKTYHHIHIQSYSFFFSSGRSRIMRIFAILGYNVKSNLLVFHYDLLCLDIYAILHLDKFCLQKNNNVKLSKTHIFLIAINERLHSANNLWDKYVYLHK